MIGKNDDGGEVSLTYFKIKVKISSFRIKQNIISFVLSFGTWLTFSFVQYAQEKKELQETGDELEAKINMAEKEIQAMENTLRLLNASNTNFRNNMESVPPNSKHSRIVLIQIYQNKLIKGDIRHICQ
jgi:predicted amino acid-binding ACT domain protein